MTEPEHPSDSDSDLPSGSPLATGQPRPARTTDLSGYGFPARLRPALGEHSLPKADRLQRWRSPLRGPWLTSVFGAVLLITVPIVISTGLLRYIAYGPQFGQAIPFHIGWLKLPTFDWPTNPSCCIGSAKDCTSGLAWC